MQITTSCWASNSFEEDEEDEDGFARGFEDDDNGVEDEDNGVEDDEFDADFDDVGKSILMMLFKQEMPGKILILVLVDIIGTINRKIFNSNSNNRTNNTINKSVEVVN